MIREILISPGYGAGWSTWNDAEFRKDLLFDEDLIAAVKAGEDLGFIDKWELENPIVPDSPLDKFNKKMEDKHGKDLFIYYGGCKNGLEVKKIEGQFIVEEYDGAEYITYRNDDTDWI